MAYIAFIFNLDNINNEQNGPSVNSTSMGGIPDISLTSISKDNQLSCETLFILGETKSYFIYFYVKPQTINGILIYNIFGGVNSNDRFIFSSDKETGVKLQKLDPYTIRCIIEGKERDLKLTKIEEDIHFVNCTEYYMNNEGIAIYNNDLKFSFYDNFIKIEKTGFLNYYLFTVPGIVNNTFPIYDNKEDNLKFYYQLPESINYIIISNFSFYFTSIILIRKASYYKCQ